MLVPGWTSYQSVIIDDVIKVTVVCNKQAQVVLGIDAPDSVEIRRQEVFHQIQQTEQSQDINI
jgi:carbon storage regulator CsrA